MIDPWRHALSAVASGDCAALLIVVDHHGSVPGTTGATAVVSQNGLAGTIGGGASEHQLCTAALELELDRRSDLVRYDHTSPDNDSLCSGSHLVAMLRLELQDQPVLEAIVATLERGALGGLELSPEGLSFAPNQPHPRRFSQDGDSWRYADTLGRRETLYIIGGGHVSLALSRIMATLPFRIVVYDDRERVPTMLANDFADERRVIDYARVADEVAEGEHSWVTIMTHGHRADAQVLRQLVGSSLRYLGMMGSSSKVAQIRAMLHAEGVPTDVLARVVAPIGLAIGSHTPEEIAISIAAQLIQLANRG